VYATPLYCLQYDKCVFNELMHTRDCGLTDIYSMLVCIVARLATHDCTIGLSTHYFTLDNMVNGIVNTFSMSASVKYKHVL